MERRAVGKSIYDSINFLEKKKRKIKILTNFNNNKSNDKSKRDRWKEMGGKIFSSRCNWEHGCKFQKLQKL